MTVLCVLYSLDSGKKEAVLLPVNDVPVCRGSRQFRE